MAKRTCSIEGREMPHWGRGWCRKHHARWLKYGDPLVKRTAANGEVLPWLIDRLQQPPTDTCWLDWPFATHTEGYPRIKSAPAAWSVLALTERPRPAPPGNWSLHSCDTPLCINPQHLRWGTALDNVRDMVTRGRQRHAPLIGENHPRSKLTDKDVRTIRASTDSMRSLGRRYGVDPKTIKALLAGRTWRHVH